MGTERNSRAFWKVRPMPNEVSAHAGDGASDAEDFAAIEAAGLADAHVEALPDKELERVAGS